MIKRRILEPKENGKLIGYFVADVDSTNVVKFGYSLCRKGDKFNKAVGLKIAESRLKVDNEKLELPISIWGDFLKFYNEAGFYYKGSTLSPITEDD